MSGGRAVNHVAYKCGEKNLQHLYIKLVHIMLTDTPIKPWFPWQDDAHVYN